MTEETTTEKVVEEVLDQKPFKLPEKDRVYFREKMREQRQWKCSKCGGKPAFKNLETKEKLCEPCTVQYLIQKSKEEKEKECTAPNSNSTNMTS
jgi:hypothetical protein